MVVTTCCLGALVKVEEAVDRGIDLAKTALELAGVDVPDEVVTLAKAVVASLWRPVVKVNAKRLVIDEG